MATVEEIRKALRQVKDPEINLSVIDLGLIYDVEIGDEGDVDVRMTLTSPGCPSGPEILADVDRVIRALDGVTDVNVELVWEPYWTPERIDPKVRTFLGYLAAAGWAAAARIAAGPSAAICHLLSSSIPSSSATRGGATRATARSAPFGQRRRGK